MSGGYFYEKEGQYLNVIEESNTPEDFIYTNLNGQHYEGQYVDAKGEGLIVNTTLYIKARYGDGWTIEKNSSLNMNGYIQNDLSCYIHNKIKNDKKYSGGEDNCWAVSAYNVLQYMADNFWEKMPKQNDKVWYNPIVSEPEIYSNYYDMNGNNKSRKLYYNNNKNSVNEYMLKTNLFFTKLYTEVRKHISNRYKQINNRGTIWDTSEVIEYIANQYGYYVNSYEHILWKFYIDKGKEKIDSGYPLLWSTAWGTYANHTMAVCGYKTYSKTVGWWIFKHKEYKVLYELRDGWDDEPRFYDMSAYWGIGAIISLEF